MSELGQPVRKRTHSEEEEARRPRPHAKFQLEDDDDEDDDDDVEVDDHDERLDGGIYDDSHGSPSLGRGRIASLRTPMRMDSPGPATVPMGLYGEPDDGPTPLTSVHRVSNRSNESFFDEEALQVNTGSVVLVPKIVNHYVLGEVIGEGSYGKVREGCCSLTLRRVAVKIMKQKRLRKIRGGEENVRRELQLLEHLHHDNVVSLYEVLHTPQRDKMYIVFEYCLCTLQDLLMRAPNKALQQHQAARYFNDLMCGLEYLHSQGVIHRDIKPGNLLLSKADALKISDFGVAEVVPTHSRDDMSSSSAGSPAFQAPEVAAGRDSFSGSKVDIWAAGVTLFNMMTGDYPFSGENVYALYHAIANDDVIIPEALPPMLVDLLRRMLEKNADVRATISLVRAHPWCLATHPRLGPDVPLLVERDFVPTACGAGGVTTSLLPYLRCMFPDACVEPMTSPSRASTSSSSAASSATSRPHSVIGSPAGSSFSAAATGAQPTSSQPFTPPPSPSSNPRSNQPAIPMHRQLTVLLRRMSLSGRSKRDSTARMPVPGFEAHTQ